MLAEVTNYTVRFTILFWLVIKPIIAVGSRAFATVKPTSKLTAMQVHRFCITVIFKDFYF
jgi:hypothetical protein